MDRNEVIEILQGSNAFGGLSRGELLQMVNACQRRTVHPGEAVWAVGEPTDATYILLRGRVERSVTVYPDGHRTTQYARPASLLSLHSLVQQLPHTSAGTALEQTEVLELARDSFEELFAAEHPASYAILDALAEELVSEMRDANRRLHEVFGHPAETLRMLRRRMRDEELGGGP